MLFAQLPPVELNGVTILPCSDTVSSSHAHTQTYAHVTRAHITESEPTDFIQYIILPTLFLSHTHNLDLSGVTLDTCSRDVLVGN